MTIIIFTEQKNTIFSLFFHVSCLTVFCSRLYRTSSLFVSLQLHVSQYRRTGGVIPDFSFLCFCLSFFSSKHDAHISHFIRWLPVECPLSNRCQKAFLTNLNSFISVAVLSTVDQLNIVRVDIERIYCRVPPI